LTTDNLDAHARVLVPVDCLKSDEASDDWFIEVAVFDRIRIRITFKHLRIHRMQAE